MNLDEIRREVDGDFEVLFSDHFEGKPTQGPILKRLYDAFWEEPGKFLDAYYLMTGKRTSDRKRPSTLEQIRKSAKPLQKRLSEMRSILKAWSDDIASYRVESKKHGAMYRLEIDYRGEPLLPLVERAVRERKEPSSSLRKPGSKRAGRASSWEERFVGRKEESERFLRLLETLDDPSRRPVTFCLYGFGGIGKSTLVELLRSLAGEAGVPIFPPLPRDELVAISLTSWLEGTFHIPVSEALGRGKKADIREPWRHFLNTLPERALIILDTTAQVDMADFNRNLRALAGAIRRQNSPHLILTCTRRKPRHGEEAHLLDGLSADEIRRLGGLRGWPDRAADLAPELLRRTDGNPLMLECICENPQLWEEFERGGLRLARRSAMVYELLDEMWGFLGAEDQQALAALAALDHYAKQWHHEWGEREAEALFKGGWDGHLYALKSAVCLREKEPGRYFIHEEMRDFARARLAERGKFLEKLGDIYSDVDPPLAQRYWAEAARCS